MARERLGGEDAAWLHMEAPTNPMVVNAVVELAAPLPARDAYALFERLAALPRFRARVVDPPLRVGLPSWEDAPEFELTRHVEHVELDVADDAALRAFLGAAVGRLLDPRYPLWHVYFIDRPGAGTTLLCRVHHAIGDGFALLDVLLSLCDQHGAMRDRPAVPPRNGRSGAVLRSVQALARLISLPTDPRTLLKGPLGIDKRVAWSAPLSLAVVKNMARMTSATVNDVLVSVTAAALGTYLARRGEDTSGLDLHAMVPVNLRAGRAAKNLGNEFGLVVLGLPLGACDPIARVAAVKERMKRLKATPEAIVTNGLLRALGWAPRALEDLAVTFFGNKASLVLTNVPGPRAPLRLAGVLVSRIQFWVPQSGRVGLGISIFSYAGEISIGVLSDAAILPDPESLVADLHDAFAGLAAQLRAEERAPAASRSPATPPSRRP